MSSRGPGAVFGYAFSPRCSVPFWLPAIVGCGYNENVSPVHKQRGALIKRLPTSSGRLQAQGFRTGSMLLPEAYLRWIMCDGLVLINLVNCDSER